MVSLVEIQAAYYMVAATGVLIAAIYYIMNIRNNQKNQQLTLEARQTQIFLQLLNYLKYEGKAWTKFMLTYEWTDFEDYMKKYGPIENPDAWEEQFKHVMTFEGIGILVSKKMIEVSLVYEAYGDWVVRYWEKFYPVMIEFRKSYGPEFLEWTEYLVNELRKYRLEKYGHDPLKIPQELAK